MTQNILLMNSLPGIKGGKLMSEGSVSLGYNEDIENVRKIAEQLKEFLKTWGRECHLIKYKKGRRRQRKRINNNNGFFCVKIFCHFHA